MVLRCSFGVLKGVRLRLSTCRRLLALEVVLAVVMSASPAPRFGGAARAAGPAPLLHTVSPRPGEVTAAGVMLLQARVRSVEPVSSVQLSVAGVAVDPVQLTERDANGEVAVSGSVSLSSGDQVAHLVVEDASGARTERLWMFHTTDRAALRLSGEDRLKTAVAISGATFPAEGSAQAAVIARADDFADALAGAPLAAAEGGPLLLAQGDALADVTARELQRALPAGSTVHLLGGDAALGNGISRDVQRLGFRAERHAGPDRFATAADVARQLPPSEGAIVASGTSFADALAASAPAARDGLPILLTAADHLPESTAAMLVQRDASVVTIVGGPAAVGDGVEEDLGQLARAVERLAGDDRYATAVAILESFYDEPSAVSLASGADFPDALAGTVHAASLDQPLLLTPPLVLAAATSEAIRRHRPQRVTVYGGASGVEDEVAAAAVRAAVDGSDAPRITGTNPTASSSVTRLDAVTVTLDRPVDPLRSSVYVEVGDHEVPVAHQETGPTTVLSVGVPPGEPAGAPGSTLAGRILVYARVDDDHAAHHDVAFTYTVPDPVFATVAEVAVHLPSRDVEMVGFHQSADDGARQMSERVTPTRTLTLPSRGRGTGSRTAADVVAAPDSPILSPVTGRVLRAGSYVLYCRHEDHFVVIEPDSHPGWQVKLLHFRGLQVGAGDQVTASQTVIGDGPRPLPFESQIDRYSQNKWPHVHIEVVDPSVPDRPGGGC